MRTANSALLPYTPRVYTPAPKMGVGGSGRGNGKVTVKVTPTFTANGNGSPTGTALAPANYLKPAVKIMGSLNTLTANYPAYPPTFSHVWVRTLPNGARVATDMYYVYAPVGTTLNG